MSDEKENNESDPKIIVDDDWKSQVEKEKQQTTENDFIPKEPESSDVGDSSNAGGEMDPPPATLEMHLTMMFTQCMTALGQVPGEDGNAGQINKPFAKYFIDTVEMLEKKTEGNRTEDESKMFADMLHAMRMAYVSIR